MKTLPLNPSVASVASTTSTNTAESVSSVSGALPGQDGLDLSIASSASGPRPLFSVGLEDGLKSPEFKARLGGVTYTTASKNDETAYATLSRFANSLRIAGYDVSISNDILTVFGKPGEAGPKKQIIIDTDMALDDWPAILYLARQPNVDLRGVTVTGAGEAHTKPGVEGALKLLSLAGLEDKNIPVAGGRETPLAGNNVFPAAWRHEADTMFGLPLPTLRQAPVEADAVTTLIDLVESATGKIDIVTLGPLTNLAEAIMQKPEIADKIGMVTIMGGAVRVKGNLIVPGFTDHITNKVAEWNLYVDPTAAGIVFESGLPITLVPLDATNSVQVTMGLLKTLEENHATPAANFVYEELKKNKGFIQSGEFYLWDPTAAVVGANLDSPIGTVEQLKVKIETTPGDEEGRTFESDEGNLVNVYTSADPKVTFNEYLEVLTGEPGLYDEMVKFNA